MEFSVNEFEKIESKKGRAKYLLQFPITTKPDIEGLDVVCRACVGDVRLPFSGKSELEVIEKAKAWLKELASL